MSEYFEFNVNNYVFVKLTKRGRITLQRHPLGEIYLKTIVEAEKRNLIT